MRNSMNVALVSLGVLLGTAGCTNFLTGDKLSENPNQPSTASIQQLFVGVQAGQFAFQEGTVPMMMCMWVQACTAVNGRFVEQAGRYNFGENSNLGANNGDWGLIYDAGGLVDIKGVEAAARSSGDSTWLGIGKVWEAFTIGSAADMWGDIPYTQVQSSPTPALDHQFVVYDSVQSLLSQAIAELGTATGTGPGVADLVFNGDRPNWVATAWTLKARYFLHTAESLGTPAYQNAITAALNGIADASGNSDFRSFHTTGTSERNMWAQFQGSSFGNDLVAGKALVDVMNGRSDPRLPQYFCLAANGGYGGQDFNTPVPDTIVSSFTCKPERFSDLFRVPYASYAENELILAEAYHATGDDPSALTHLNNERATVPLPALVGITGAALLDSIMTEKFVALFQNIETISDYRRTCIPAITPVTPNVLGFTVVPGRLFYAQIERNVNPNIPDGSTQLATHGFRNEGDVNPCP